MDNLNDAVIQKRNPKGQFEKATPIVVVSEFTWPHYAMEVSEIALGILIAEFMLWLLK